MEICGLHTIIQAPGWWALFNIGGEKVLKPLVCWAKITIQTHEEPDMDIVAGMVVDDNGKAIVICEQDDGFERYRHIPEQPHRQFVVGGASDDPEFLKHLGDKLLTPDSLNLEGGKAQG